MEVEFLEKAIIANVRYTEDYLYGTSVELTIELQALRCKDKEEFNRLCEEINNFLNRGDLDE